VGRCGVARERRRSMPQSSGDCVTLSGRSERCYPLGGVIIHFDSGGARAIRLPASLESGISQPNNSLRSILANIATVAYLNYSKKSALE
jgi:hypothetical protein